MLNEEFADGDGRRINGFKRQRVDGGFLPRHEGLTLGVLGGKGRHREVAREGDEGFLPVGVFEISRNVRSAGRELRAGQRLHPTVKGGEGDGSDVGFKVDLHGVDADAAFSFDGAVCHMGRSRDGSRFIGCRREILHGRVDGRDLECGSWRHGSILNVDRPVRHAGAGDGPRPIAFGFRGRRCSACGTGCRLTRSSRFCFGGCRTAYRDDGVGDHGGIDGDRLFG